MSLTAGEQYLLELINRGRLDPAAEAARYNLGLNAGLSKGTIDTSAKQVLAPNEKVETAATNHSAWMLANDSFSHGGVGGSNAGDRMQSAGYTFTGTWAWRENLAWLGSTGNISLETSIAQHHEGLYRSESHRVNTFADNMREIGIGQVGGSFTYQGTTYNSSMVTEKFALSGSDVFVTGVAYRDADKDHFYSMGEGQGGVWVRADGAQDTTAAAGGYAVKIAAQDDVRVVLGVGDTRLAVVDLDTDAGNVKVDIVTHTDGTRVMDLSGSARLVSGIPDATLLGSANLDMRGSNKSNTLTGNTGDNLIEGKGGNDTIHGGDGNDRLDGGYNGDLIYGGDGDDLVIGYSGFDRIYGGNGNDRMLGGTGGDMIWGDTGNDLLLGQNGNDRLYGGAGNDRMLGGSGTDLLYGGAGSDLIDGGGGTDLMHGGAGADRFVFSGGRDQITDFTDNVDTIYLRHEIVGAGTTVAEALADARIVGGDAVFHFSDNNVLTVRDVSDLHLLANDMIIV
ncbi:MAG: hypothetical protein KKB02_14830 [Alphaproteobacteria bacterium]|nr:hypothetical protein [Alphaproteobacteria bacterium]